MISTEKTGSMQRNLKRRGNSKGAINNSQQEALEGVALVAAASGEDRQTLKVLMEGIFQISSPPCSEEQPEDLAAGAPGSGGRITRPNFSLTFPRYTAPIREP